MPGRIIALRGAVTARAAGFSDTSTDASLSHDRPYSSTCRALLLRSFDVFTVVRYSVFLIR